MRNIDNRGINVIFDNFHFVHDNILDTIACKNYHNFSWVRVCTHSFLRNIYFITKRYSFYVHSPSSTPCDHYRDLYDILWDTEIPILHRPTDWSENLFDASFYGENWHMIFTWFSAGNSIKFNNARPTSRSENQQKISFFNFLAFTRSKIFLKRTRFFKSSKIVKLISCNDG